MSAEPVLKAFEESLSRAGFVAHRSGSNPFTFRLEHEGDKIGQVKVWAPLKPKFNEVRDKWRDSVRACWSSEAGEREMPAPASPHWQTVDRILVQLAPYRDDFLDFEDLTRILITALMEDRLPIPAVEALRHDFYAIERIVKSRGRS